MSTVTLALALICVAGKAVSAVDGGATATLRHPIELTDLNFDDSIADGRPWIVMFYAPWCGHCKKARPMWEKLASSSVLESKQVRVARADGSAGAKLSMSKWAIEYARMTSYPSILRFEAGKVWSWTGERRANKIESWGLDPLSDAIPPPTILDKIAVKATGYLNEFARWLSSQSSAVMIGVIVLLGMTVLLVGFLIGYWWREWYVESWVNVRWGEGRFIPFAMIPLQSDVKLIRKSAVTGDIVPWKHQPQTDTEIWVQFDGKEHWLPSLQQFDPNQKPTRKAPTTDAKKKES